MITFLRELASVKSLVSPALFVTCGPFAHEYFVMLSAPPNTPFSKKNLIEAPSPKQMEKQFESSHWLGKIFAYPLAFLP
jgi:hypothetical protein